jgi:hypothetical protein
VNRSREWSLEVGATVLVGSLLLLSLIIGISIYIKFYASGSYYLQVEGKQIFTSTIDVKEVRENVILKEESKLN